nr:SIR2 family protein [Rhodoplanes tepidamans]
MDEGWNEYLRNVFLRPAYQPNKVHELIFELDAGIYLTPNFDKIFDNYVTERTDGTTIIKTYYDDDVHQLIRGGTRLILKMHGSIDSPDRMIFGRAKYSETRIKFAPFYHLIDALLLTNTFLMIGCGLNDPDFQLLFENYSYRFPSGAPHYMTYADPAPQELESLLRDTRKIKLLKYSRAAEHKELEDSLVELNKKVEDERESIAASFTW